MAHLAKDFAKSQPRLRAEIARAFGVAEMIGIVLFKPCDPRLGVDFCSTAERSVGEAVEDEIFALSIEFVDQHADLGTRKVDRIDRSLDAVGDKRVAFVDVKRPATKRQLPADFRV